MEGAMRSSKSQSVDSATASICQSALEAALALVRDKVWYLGPDGGDGLREVLARNIAAHAASGETDAKKLKAHALRTFFLHQWNWLSPTPSLTASIKRRKPRTVRVR